MADFASVLAEVNAFLPFLLSDEPSQEVKGTTDAVRARLFVRGGERRLLVVNATREQQSATLSCDGFPACRLALAPLETLVVEQSPPHSKPTDSKADGENRKL